MVAEFDRVVRVGRTSAPCKEDDRTTQCRHAEIPVRQCNRCSIAGWRYEEVKPLIRGCHPHGRYVLRPGSNSVSEMQEVTLHVTH